MGSTSIRFPAVRSIHRVAELDREPTPRAARLTRAEQREVTRDACVTPVLSFAEVHTERHIAARATFYHDHGHLLPTLSPRFSRSVPAAPTPPGVPAVAIDAVLREWA
jgi:crotonobetainyl-CoA:carnitine CoA-transferase CaiB-like acyl-CoA transferase